jgi:hypothetical protein
MYPQGMVRQALIRLGVLVTLAVLALSACGEGSQADGTPTHKGGIIREGSEADQIRAIEHKRLRALVEADMEVARQLHAEDFQLITPTGDSLSREQYLGAVASGDIDYLVWKPDAIEVRLSGEMALIRYSSQLEIVVGSQRIPLRHYWHTDSYERRNGHWQAVWSQATEIR